MEFYSSVDEVQTAYLTKATEDASECPTQTVVINGEIKSSSQGSSPFFHVDCCPVEVTGRVSKKYVSGGKVKDEAPILITSDTGDFLGGEKKVYVFITPGLGDDSLTPSSIESDGLVSGTYTVTFKAGHNFAIKSEATTVNLYKSCIDHKLYEESELPEQDQEKCLAKYTAEIKRERDSRIADTDSYIQIADVTVQSEEGAKRSALSDEERELIKDYRQELRDLPEAEGFPFVSFPEIPDCISYEAQAKIDARAEMMEAF